MPEAGHQGIAWLNQGEDYFRNQILGKSPDITGLNPITIERLDEMFIFARRHPVQVRKRTNQIDEAIKNFNHHHATQEFDETHINAISLSKLIGPDKGLPSIKDNAPTSESDQLISMFKNEVARGTYKFIEATPNSTSLMKHLITATLIDGYGLAVISQHFKGQKRLSVGMQKLSDFIVNAVCEETNQGTVQREIWQTGWFNPQYGFAKTLSKKMDSIYRGK